jgi:hypothetical protein
MPLVRTPAAPKYLFALAVISFALNFALGVWMEIRLMRAKQPKGPRFTLDERHSKVFPGNSLVRYRTASGLIAFLLCVALLLALSYIR